MTQSCVRAFVRQARVGVLAAVMVVLGVSALVAQSATGKVEGRVRDQAGAPIANAQVFIVGTTFQARTSPAGYYFLNNVPAGTVVLQVGFIGYKSAQVTNVRVLGNQTISQDVTLEATPFEVAELTVTIATSPLVPRDEVTTKQRVAGGYTERLPVDRIVNALALQPGVVASQSGGTLSIRGGRTDETAIAVDGVPIGAGNRGTFFRAATGSIGTGLVGTNAFEEASITTGSASAEFGGAQSGVISITTKSGGPTYTGSLSYETDAPFGTKGGIGFNRITGSIGGPVAGALTFFVAGDLEGRRSLASGQDRKESPIFVIAGVDTTVAVPSALGDPVADTTMVAVEQYAIYTGECDRFANSENSGIKTNYDIDCRGIRMPGTGGSLYKLTGKLNYSLPGGSRFSVTALAAQNQTRNDFDQSNPQDQFATRTWNRNLTFNWTQNLAKSAERALALEIFGSYQEDRFINSPLARDSDFDSYQPFGGFFIKPYEFLFDFESFPLNDELLDNYKNNKPGTRRNPYDLENINQYFEIDEYRNNAEARTGINETGGPIGRVLMSKENRWIGKANVDWQVNRLNRIKLGGQFTKFKMWNYDHDLDEQIFSDFFIGEPIAWNAYIQNRLDLGDVVVEAGLRYSRYDSKATRPFHMDSAGTGQYDLYFPRPNTNQGVFEASTLPAGHACADSIFVDPVFGATSAGCKKTIFVRDDSHDYLSPHIQVAFPVTDRTNFRLSYAHQVQVPDFSLIFGGMNTDLAITNTNNRYGADLDFGRTITFEFGIRHSFSDDMVLDVALYNKDNISNAAGRLVSLFDPLFGRNQDIRLLTNADFGNTKGIDVRLDRRFGNLFNGTVSYTFQDAKNTGTDPDTYLSFGSRIVNQVLGGNQPPPQAILPTDNSRPHSLAGSFALSFPDDWREGTGVGAILQNVGLFATFRLASGTAFTRCPDESGNENILSGFVCSGDFVGDQNGARLPTFKQFDLRLTKGFQLRGVDVTTYVDARNVFNFKNITSVFAVTNDIRNRANEDQVWRGDSSEYAREAAKSGWYDSGTGEIDLTFGTGTPDQLGMCASWTRQDGVPSAPNCVYLIRAEQRYGDGDGTYTLAEQRAASDAAYGRAAVLVGPDGGALWNFTGRGRNVRLGIELNF